MTYYKFKMKIIGYQYPYWLIKICSVFRKTYIYYNPDNKDLSFPRNGSLGKFLKDRKVQLLRILNNKSSKSYYRSFRLTFVLSKDFIQPHYFNRDLITVIDRRNYRRKVYTKSIVSHGNHCEVFTDGSLNHKNNKGAYAVMIKRPDCNTEMLSYQEQNYSNNALELKAVVTAFEKVKDEKCIVVTTDSQYVIRGICYWIQNWKKNKWRTADGKIVRNIEQWKKLDRLLKLKYVEFRWVRSHRNHPENNLCDFISKQKTKE